MTGRVETADGKVYELPALLEWRLRRTGGVPCDSFRVKCLYSAEMGEALKAACRFAATENGVTRFRGVIDEWSAVCGAEDARELTVTLAGSVDAEPMDRVELSLARLGVRGTFRVSETLYTLSASGETTELTLWEV